MSSRHSGGSPPSLLPTASAGHRLSPASSSSPAQLVYTMHALSSPGAGSAQHASSPSPSPSSSLPPASSSLPTLPASTTSSAAPSSTTLPPSATPPQPLLSPVHHPIEATEMEKERAKLRILEVELVRKMQETMAMRQQLDTEKQRMKQAFGSSGGGGGGGSGEQRSSSSAGFSARSLSGVGGSSGAAAGVSYPGDALGGASRSSSVRDFHDIHTGQPDLSAPVVDVNVGGQVFTTLRATLCAVPGSFLEAIFSGRHRILRHQGAVFIDRSPKYFEQILDYLRSPTPARIARLPLNDILFVEELQYYGLYEAVRGRTMKQMVVVVGGQNERHMHLSSAEYFDDELGEWKPCAAMGQARAHVGFCVLQGLLYIAGGQDAGPCSTTERYNVAHNAWITVAPMKASRSGLACAAHLGHVYAAGGMAAGRRLSLVEVYDPVCNEWTTTTPLPLALSLLSLCSVGKYLYAVGGEEIEGGEPSNRAFRFDEATKLWAPIAPMRTARDTFACASLDGMLYVCGGWGGSKALALVERYVPERDEWTSVASMPTERVAACATAVDGCLVVLGGYDSRNCLDSGLRYHPLEDRWEPLPPMRSMRYAAACGTLPRWQQQEELVCVPPDM